MLDAQIRYFWLLLSVLVVSTAYAQSQSIHVEWGYTPPSQPRVSGFKLYQEGVFACQADDPKATAMDCTVAMTSTPTNFTLTATFVDGTESPHSAPFAFSPTPDSSRDSGRKEREPTALISTSVAAGTAPLTVAFDGTGSSAANGLALVGYLWDFGDGSSARLASVTHTYQEPGTYTATLTVTDSQRLRKTAQTPVVVRANPKRTAQKSATTTSTQTSVSAGSSDRTRVAQAASSAASDNMPLRMEAGELALTTVWMKVAFSASYTQPVVIAGSSSFKDKDSCPVRLRNVTSKGFEIRLGEWPSQGGRYGSAIVNYLVMEQGRATLKDGAMIEAGRFHGTTGMNMISFAGQFSQAPVILTSIASASAPAAVTGRVGVGGRAGFAYLLQEHEKNKRSAHKPEVVHYIAWEPGMGRLGPLGFEAAHAAQMVSSTGGSIRPQGGFGHQPLLIAERQTLGGGDPVARQVQKVVATGLQSRVQEQQSRDTETVHRAEEIGYVALYPLAEPRMATFSWEWHEEKKKKLQGFRVVANGEVLCTTSRTTARSLMCPLPAGLGQVTFAMEAIYANNEVSKPSNSLVYRPPQRPGAGQMAQLQ